MYTQVDHGGDNNLSCYPKGEHCVGALKHTCKHDATQNGRQSVTMFRGDMLPIVECAQLESIWDEHILEQDAPHSDSVWLHISSLKPSKVLRERVTGGKPIFVLFQLSFLLWRCSV